MVNPEFNAAHEKQRYWRIRPKNGGMWCVGETREWCEDMADGAPLDDYEIEETWHTPDEFEALREFEGW